MPDYLNNEQKYLLKVIGHAWSTIYAIDRLAIGDSKQSELSRIADTADLLEQTAMVLRARAAELHVQTDNGADSTLPVDGASDKTCPACGGKGYCRPNYPTSVRTCFRCGGTGHVSD